MNQMQLKSRLTELEQDSSDLASKERWELTTVMLANIGSPDPELRDDLIYSILSSWIIEKRFTDKQLQEILQTCLDQNHLFFGVGDSDTDKVFTRSFSTLIIAALLYYDSELSSFLSPNELHNAKDRILEYAGKERDVRGYVADKGWAHSVAHLGDCLNYLAKSKHLQPTDLQLILDVVIDKVKIKDTVYSCGEDERLVTAVTTILKRNMLDDKTVTDWISRFPVLDINREWPHDYWYVTNIKSFLRSLYFRTMDDQSLAQAHATTLQAIKELTKEFPGYF